jgi:hypothetical protein
MVLDFNKRKYDFGCHQAKKLRIRVHKQIIRNLFFQDLLLASSFLLLRPLSL